MPLWDRTLDLVVLTHPDNDHGLAQTEAPARFAIDTAWAAASDPASPKAALWWTTMNAAGANVQVQAAGGWVDLGDGVALWVVSPLAVGFSGDSAENDNSLVTKLVLR